MKGRVLEAPRTSRNHRGEDVALPRRPPLPVAQHLQRLPTRRRLRRLKAQRSAQQFKAYRL
jgi:hypothetical protein